MLRKNPGVVLTTEIQRSMERAVAAAFPNQIITSGTRYVDVGSGYDNHMAGRALDFAASGALASWIARTYPNSAELYWDPGPNIKNGNPTRAIGGHSDHVHWAMASIVDPYTGKVVSQDGPGGGGGGFFSLLANQFFDFLENTILNPLKSLIPEKPVWTHGVLDGSMTAVFDGIREWATGLIGSSGGGDPYNGPVGDGVERWRPLVVSILKSKQLGEGLADTVLRRMNQESGGNPRAINNWDSNAAKGTPSKGLMQVIDPTFQSNKDPGFNDIWDPEANIRASPN